MLFINLWIVVQVVDSKKWIVGCACYAFQSSFGHSFGYFFVTEFLSAWFILNHMPFLYDTLSGMFLNLSFLF